MFSHTVFHCCATTELTSATYVDQNNVFIKFVITFRIICFYCTVTSLFVLNKQLLKIMLFPKVKLILYTQMFMHVDIQAMLPLDFAVYSHNYS